jgi:NAD(P)H dehydrogenase (quinone)
MGTRILIVLAGARTQGLGHHLLQVVLGQLEASGASATVHDLLQDGFDPVLRLDPDQAYATEPERDADPLAARYARDVRLADGIIILHPVWWFSVPAILKGWVDRILVHRVALEQHESGPPTGLLANKQMLVVQTFNCKSHIDKMVFMGMSGFFWKRVIGLATGMSRVRRLSLYGVASMGQSELNRFEDRLRRSVAALAK